MCLCLSSFNAAPVARALLTLISGQARCPWRADASIRLATAAVRLLLVRNMDAAIGSTSRACRIDIPSSTTATTTTTTTHDNKKSCNCVKSRCLKLYCDCFAQGVYCSGCSCQDCHNSEDHAGLVASKRAGIREKNPEVLHLLR